MFDDGRHAVILLAVVNHLFGCKIHIVDVRQLRSLMKHCHVRAIVVRQRAQEHAIDDAKNGTIGSDAQSQGEHGRQGEARILE